jgi:hypothetical protein
VDRTLRPLGFLVLVLGLGLRLDTPWQGVAWVLIVTGASCGAAGLWMLARRQGAIDPFVRRGGGG